MKLALLLLVFIFANFTEAATTEVLAMRLWNVYNKETNASYETLDNYRLKLSNMDPVKIKLDNPENFKAYQTVLRNRFIDRVSKEFSRKEIINLTAIYKRPEMTKMRLLAMDFFDEKEIKTLFSEFDPSLPPLPPK